MKIGTIFLLVLFVLPGCATAEQNNGLVEQARLVVGLVERVQPQPRQRKSFRYGKEVAAAAQRYAIPPAFILAIIKAESDFNPHAVSHKGAVGLMQVMPSTARWIAPGVSRKQLFHPATNIEIGARYLRYLANRYRGDARKILVAWHAGPSRMDRNVFPRETVVFIRRVERYYWMYQET